MNKRGLRVLLPLLLLAAAGVYQYLPQPAPQPDAAPASATIVENAALPAFLPPEAHATLARIAHNGPFPHRQDGSVFHNRERLLPAKPRGYYHEYTVATPGADDRGARRIVTGGNPPEVYYYTADHYQSFRKFTLHNE